MTAADTDVSQHQDLVDRLISHGVDYLLGGSSESSRSAAPLDLLLLDLARAPHSRLRGALVALLLRHPDYAPQAEAVARALRGDDPAGRLLLLSVVVAAALQAEWRFTLDLYLPNRPRIHADHLARELDLPPPGLDYGRPCLAAAASLLREGNVFPINYEADWENAAHRLRAQLVREARERGT